MSKDYEDVDSFRVQGDQYCIADELINEELKGTDKLKSCGSSDAMSTYQNEHTDGSTTYTSYCYSCSQKFNSDLFSQSSYASEFGIEGGLVTSKKTFERPPKKSRITRDEIIEVTSHGSVGKGYRGLQDHYLKYFGHIVKHGGDGKPKVIFYPETAGGKMSGYKSRTLPKSFGYENYGLTGINSDLSGQFKFKDMEGGRDILIVGGELDQVSSFQIWDLYEKSRKGQEGYLTMPIVSPTTGEGSAVKQLIKHYDFINSFSNIILGLDNDEAGRDAMEAIAQVFPRSKIKIINWTKGDPNSYIHNKEGIDHSKQFVRDFYNAKPYISGGIITSKEADDLIEAELLRPKVALPEFMKELQKLMAGGVPLGYWVNWIAESGVGKSTLVNEAIRHMIFNSEYKVGILSLELTAAQYLIAMLSREVGVKINLFETPQEAVDFVRRPDIVVARKHLTENEFGEERFIILDERDGELDEVKNQCDLLINKHGCRILVIDPIQDLFEGVSMDQQNSFIKWMKSVLKRGICFQNVCHVRKGGNSTDKEGKRILRELTEDDVHGISGIVKSAGANVFMSRNKYAESEIEKNTTFITMGKCRWTGNTGRVPPWFYKNSKHTMYDLNTYFKEHPEELEVGYDLTYNPFDKSKKTAKGSSSKTKIPHPTDTVAVNDDFI